MSDPTRVAFAVVWSAVMAYVAILFARAFRSMREAERSFRALKRYDVLEAKWRGGWITDAERIELAELKAWIALESYRRRHTR